LFYNTPQEQTKRAGFVPSWCSVTKTEAKPSTGTRQACKPQARRALYKRGGLYLFYNTPQEQTQRAGFVPSWCSVTKTEAKPSTGTRQACEPQAKRVPHTKEEDCTSSTIRLKNNPKELASYPRGARRPKPKPNHRPARARPASLRRNACHTQNNRYTLGLTHARVRPNARYIQRGG